MWFKRCQPARLPELPPHLDGLHLLRTVLALLLPPPTYPTSSVLGLQSPLLQPHPLTSPHSLQPGAPAPDGTPTFSRASPRQGPSGQLTRHQAPSARLPTRWTAQAWQFASSIPERYRAQVLTSSHLMSPSPPTPVPLHRDILTASILPRSQLSSYLPRSQGSQVLSLPLRQTSQSLPPFLSSHTGHLRLRSLVPGPSPRRPQELRPSPQPSQLTQSVPRKMSLKLRSLFSRPSYGKGCYCKY